MATTTESIQQLYIAYFNRPADAGGLAFWLDSVSKGVSLKTISQNFAAQDEYKVTFAHMSEDAIINQIYLNLFNRSPEVGGLNYWSNLLRTKVLTIDTIVNDIASSAQQDPAKGPDTISIQSKVAAAVAFTDYLNTDVSARIAYSTGGVNQIAKDYVHSVSTVATLTAAKLDLPATGHSMVVGTEPVGTTFSLSIGPDTKTGTSANDTFNANFDSANKAETFTDLDVIDGGAGNDTLNIVSTAAIASVPSATVKNVETANLVSSSTVETDASGWTGLTQLNATGVGAVTLVAAATTNVKAVASTVDVNNISVDGGKDVVINASGITKTGTITVGGTTAAKGAVSVTTAQKASAADITSGDITVNGGTTVTVNANLKGAAVNTTITGGAIKVNGTADTTVVSVTQTAAATAAAKVAGVTDGAVTIADVNAGDLLKAATISTVSLTNYADSTISSNALTNLTLSGTAGKVGITSGLTKETVTTLNLTVNNLSGTDNTITDVSNHFKTINVTGTGKDSTITNIVDSAATALNIAGDKVVTFTGVAGLTKLATVGVAGSGGVVIDVAALGTVTAVDASASTGANSVTLDATKATFTGGSGVDTVTLAKDATKAIDGGAGTADELVINVAAATALANVSANTKITGFEVLGLGTAADGNYDATGFASLHVAAGVGAAVGFINAAAGSVLSIDGTPGQEVDFTLKTNTASDAVTVNLGTATTDGIDNSATVLGLVSVESVTLNSLGSNEAGTGVNKVQVVDATAASLTITGTESITVTGFGSSTLSNIDVTAIGTKLAVDLTGVTLAAAGVTFKGGDGNYSLTDTNLAAGKVLTYTAGNGDNTLVDSSATSGKAIVTLGDGANIVTLAATTGANSVTAGMGLNKIVLGTGASVVTIGVDTDDADTITIGTPASANNYSTITGLTTGDILSFADKGTEVWLGGTATTAKIALDASTALFADYIAAATVGDGSTNGAFSWFQFGGATYVVEDKSAGAAFVAGTDVIVKLTGTVDLSKATLGDHIITFA